MAAWSGLPALRLAGKIGKVEGKSARPGLYYCGECKSQFTVTIGTIFERSKVPLSKWWFAIHLLASSKKGMSSNQLPRMLGVTVQTAWFMSHRIREAMRLDDLAPMGGGGSIVEVDETYIGRKEGFEVKQGAWHKNAVLTLVERGGSARSFHVDSARKSEILPIVRANFDRESHVMTDEAATYAKLGDEFAGYDLVDHSRGEYDYTNRNTGTKINTNTVEGFDSIFKRGMKGVYQHCGKSTFIVTLPSSTLRYSNRVKLGVNDAERAAKIVKGAKGKRLQYRRPGESPLASVYAFLGSRHLLKRVDLIFPALK